MVLVFNVVGLLVYLQSCNTRSIQASIAASQ